MKKHNIDTLAKKFNIERSLIAEAVERRYAFEQTPRCNEDWFVGYDAKQLAGGLGLSVSSFDRMQAHSRDMSRAGITYKSHRFPPLSRTNPIILADFYRYVRNTGRTLELTAEEEGLDKKPGSSQLSIGNVMVPQTLGKIISYGQLIDLYTNLEKGTESAGYHNEGLLILRDYHKTLEKLGIHVSKDAIYPLHSLQNPSHTIRQKEINLHPVLINRLVGSGHLWRGFDGAVDPAAIAAHHEFMEEHYLLSDRISYLAQKADITPNTCRVKLYILGKNESFLINIGKEGIGKSLYVYRKADEGQLIEALQRKPRGWERGPVSELKAARSLLDDLIRMSVDEVSKKIGLSDDLTKIVIGRAGVPIDQAQVGNISVPAIARDDYRKVNDYVWSRKKL